MANGFIIINDKDWEKAEPEQRDWMVFNTLKSIDARLSKLENRQIYDKVSSFIGGIFGGIVAVIGKWFFWKN